LREVTGIYFVLYICQTVTYIYFSFTQYWKVVETLYLSRKLQLMLLNGGVILKVKGQGHWKWKCKNRFRA